MRKSVSHVVIVSVSLFLPIILHAQELTADVVIHRTNGEDAKGKLYRGKMPVVHQNLPRTEKAVNPCPLCPRTFDVLLSHSANRVDPNPTKKEGWGAKTTNQGACPEMKSR